MRALQILLADLVDYAGLFPPAALAMGDAVRRYATYRAGDESWMLGRFVVPAARLEELATAAAPHLPNGSGWRLSALLGADPPADLAGVAAFHARVPAGAARVDSLEAKVAAPGDVADVGRLAATGAWPLGQPLGQPLVFAEVPGGADVGPFADAARDAGIALKLRTGGVTAEAFPSPDVVLDFMAACIGRGVPFKLTAGLHHPLRGEHPLTYERGCAQGTMFGFAGVFAAAALLAAGHPPPDVAALLDERDPAAITSGTDALCWRGRCATVTDVAAARRLALSFGSCSFDEPVRDLHALGLLPPPPDHLPRRTTGAAIASAPIHRS